MPAASVARAGRRATHSAPGAGWRAAPRAPAPRPQVEVVPRQQRLEPLEPAPGGVAGVRLQEPLEPVDDGMERAVPPVVHAATLQPVERLLAEPAHELQRKPRFADPRPAGHEDALPRSHPGLPPALEQEIALLLR